MSALLFKAMSERHFGAKRLRQRTAGSKITALVVFCVPRARIARSIAIHIHRWRVLRWLKRTRLGRWLAKASVRGRTQAQPLLVPPPEQNRHRNGDAKWGEHTPAARSKLACRRKMRPGYICIYMYIVNVWMGKRREQEGCVTAFCIQMAARLVTCARALDVPDGKW